MKKTFLVKRNALLSGRNLSWGAVALAFVLLLLLLRLFAPNFLLKIVTPILQVSDTLAAKSHAVANNFSSAAKLAVANERLITENTSLMSENHALEKKVTVLEALLNSSGAQKDIPGILAGVVARPPVSPYDTLVLAGGKNDGIALDMEAFGDRGTPVGIVSSVLSDFSRVTLFSAPGMVTSGWVGQANVPLTLSGAGGGALKASVARAANIAVGDTVFVAGPGMKAIGTVVRVDSDPLSPGVTLRIMSMINLFSLSWIVVRATGVASLSFATSTLP